MSRNRSLWLGAVLLITAIVTLPLVPDATAQSTFKTLHRFKPGANGRTPYASSLIFDQVGNLYGTTEFGGDRSNCGRARCGVVFKLTSNTNGSWTESVLHSFTGADGANPLGGLIFDADGNLYGTTFVGGASTGCGGGPCGTVFKLKPNPDGSWTESVLHSFTFADGANPTGALIFDAVGNLYGTTTDGGSTSCGSDVNCGTVFKLAPNPDGTWTESVLHSFTGFTGRDGSAPYAGLIFDADGNLYGTTGFGGASTGCGCGTIFKLKPNPDGSWTEKVLHHFTGDKDGREPYDGLIFDAAGNLYGTTSFGGDLTCNAPYGCGVVFRLGPNSNGGWREAVLHNFFDHPGAYPFAGVIFDAAGNLYGTTQGDSSGTFGSVFEITP